MFHSARIKLTTWYLLIIMLVSMIFSVVIYTIVTRELGRGFRRAEMRFRAEELDASLPPRLPRHLEKISPQLIEDLDAAKKRLALNLLIINGAIFGFSAVAGYFLAGKTLKPIEITVEDQKRFVADASHELRTPLTALKTSIEVALREKKMSLKEAKEILKGSLEDINALQSLSDNLLSLANLQSNSQSFVFEDLGIAEVVKSAAQKILPLAKKKNIDVRVKVKKQIIQADRQSLGEMILIFLDNAVKFTPGGGKIMLTTKPEVKNLIIKVKDTGIGIPKKDISHIFDRFYRVDQSRSKDSVPGFGLGLSLAKKIIEKHKGSVIVASILGKGTTFTIKLPFRHF